MRMTGCWLLPFSQAGTIKLAVPPSTLVRLYYLIATKPPFPGYANEATALDMQMKHLPTPLPWPVVNSHIILAPETLAISPGALIPPPPPINEPALQSCSWVCSLPTMIPPCTPLCPARLPSLQSSSVHNGPGYPEGEAGMGWQPFSPWCYFDFS